MRPSRKQTDAEKPKPPPSERKFQVGILLGPRRAALLEALVRSELLGSSPSAVATTLLNRALETTLLDGTLEAICPSDREHTALQDALQKARQER